MLITTTVPGHRTPGVGVESPFELMGACHHRVQRSLALLDRLQRHILDRGCDADARSAAQDVMRYFDLAAPHHHQDEELHVFPILLAGSDTVLHGLVRKLQSEHHLMELSWQAARQVLVRISDGQDAGWRLHSTEIQCLGNFSALYGQHIQVEEQQVYPAAAAKLSPADLEAMGHEMGKRRGQ